ncbi:hypothetical protein ACHWQZ_G011167 [Mnemiopsis leidyi]
MKMLLLLLACFPALARADFAWSYKCGQDSVCQRVPLADTNGEYIPLPKCRLACKAGGTLWPFPTGEVRIGSEVVSVNVGDFSIEAARTTRLQEAVAVFKNHFKSFTAPGEAQVKVQFQISDESSDLSLATDESYRLWIQTHNGNSIVVITALTFQGGRHGLETLSQLIQCEDQSCYMSAEVLISDAPKYPWRGVLLDTSRNYFTVPTIKKVIDGLSASKLNTFHWHITDTHSFPFYSKRRPKMTEWGAYSPEQIYTEEDIKDIVHYADVRGVRVLPELDAPAHSGNGYQWGEEEGLGKLAVCVNRDPWEKYCVEPPCGQMNLANPNLYDVVEDIYRDMLDTFTGSAFHIGGDEVNFNCWNTTKEVTDYMDGKNIPRTEEGFMELWNEYQEEALARFKKANGGKLKDMILWTSHMTEPEFLHYLDPSIYTVQYWESSTNKQLPNLVKKGFQVIMSNYDDLYLDCGFGAWVGEGNNWCSPYKGWQKIYMNDPKKYLAAQGVTDPALWSKIVGGETAMWTEQAGDQNAMTKIFPRSYALAERYWSDPATGWFEAEPRLVYFNSVMEKQRGIFGNTLKPEWCVQSQGICKLNKF